MENRGGEDGEHSCLEEDQVTGQDRRTGFMECVSVTSHLSWLSSLLQFLCDTKTETNKVSNLK